MPKLLLVEDNEDNRDMLARRLERRGYQLVFAVDGGEAIAQTRLHRPDLVLMDLNLPGMDGWEATRRLKADSQTREIPVIALTAHAMSGDRETALAAGCDDYEVKPIELPRLLEKIDRLIEQSKPKSTPAVPVDYRMQHALMRYLRHELCTPIDAILGYCELLIDEQRSDENLNLIEDLRKIQDCGHQLLTLTRSILDPDQLELSALELDMDAFGANIRLNLLTPLSTIIGYCELLLEEASEATRPDLTKVYEAAQRLFQMINDIVTLAQQQLQAIALLDPADLSLASTAVQEVATTLQFLNQEPLDKAPQGGTILVIDDNETNRDLLSRQLMRQGYEVAIAASGSAALAQLQTQSYDLILLDLIMPETNGLDLLQQLKASPEWRSIPVIMISALDELDLVVRCVELGADDYLSKPFQPILLHTKIATCLERQRLRHQQVLYLAQRLIAEATPIPVLISRRSDGTILYANGAAGQAVGLSVDELLQRSTLDFYADATERQTILEQLANNQPIHSQELQCQKADGTKFWVTASFQPLTFNGEATILSALCDITDRKQAEANLRIAEAKYRSIFENAVEGIYQSTIEGRFISVNPAMAKIHGYDSPEAMLAAVTEIEHQIYLDAQGRAEFRRLVEEQGQVTGFEYQVCRQDGEMIWVSESARAVRDGTGQLLYYEGIIEEVTERKLKEAKLKRQVEALQIEIDQVKRDRQVAEITQTDYFQAIKAEADKLRIVEDPQIISQPKKPKVLLVEDNELNREMLARRLQRSGYEVILAVNGEEGIAKTLIETPHIILMDMNMPVLDGWQATQQLKSNPQTRSIPVIALTAHIRAEDQQRAIAAGCDDYDTKPVELPRLLNKITTLLQTKPPS